MKDHCVLNDLEEQEGKEFLVLIGQYSIEIFSCCLHLLPLYSSTFHQTNVESTQIRFEDIHLISRIQSPHLLLEVILRDEDKTSSTCGQLSFPSRVAAWLVLSGASAGGFALSFVFSQWFLHAGDLWRARVLADLPGAI